jgi:hypothetical protein
MSDPQKTDPMADIRASIAESKRIKSLIPEPKCPLCEAGVDRPKCMFELGGDCPRHEVKREWLAACRALDAEQKSRPPMASMDF